MNTLDTIHKTADERLQLWRKAGKGSLTPAETRRLQETTHELEILWDRYRREYAGDGRVRNSEYVKKSA